MSEPSHFPFFCHHHHAYTLQPQLVPACRLSPPFCGPHTAKKVKPRLLRITCCLIFPLKISQPFSFSIRQTVKSTPDSSPKFIDAKSMEVCRVRAPYSLLGFLLNGRERSSVSSSACFSLREYFARVTNFLLWIALVSITFLLCRKLARLFRLWASGTKIPGPPCPSFFAGCGSARDLTGQIGFSFCFVLLLLCFWNFVIDFDRAVDSLKLIFMQTRKNKD